MKPATNLLSPMFSSAFNCRFNSDFIDLDDRDEIEDLAETVVGDLMLRGMTAVDILGVLEQAMAHWGPEILEEFTDASNVDWGFDAETEGDLRFIIDTMIDTARRRSVPAKAAE